MSRVHVYQILTHYTVREDLDPGFRVLDNSANERRDWYEYWPIRRFLLGEALAEDGYYGFLSPRFKAKTNLAAAQVESFIERAPPGVDVFLFSPSIHNSAYFWNVFEHGESEHPGLKRIAASFLQRIDPASELDELVSDSRNTVHSNYFIARPRFWRAWLAITERLFALAESPDDPLGAELRTRTQYRGKAEVEMKIFVMERIASWLLARDATFSVRVRDPFAARSRLYKLPLALVCDALKIAYATQGRSQYRDVFFMVRALRRGLNLQIRLADRLRLKSVHPALLSLRSYWHSGGQ